MSQENLAFECDYADYSQINRIELGKVNFSISYLKLIADKLNVSIADLLTTEQ
jgi:transcriptional regulator with XRE-family HTH domain